MQETEQAKDTYDDALASGHGAALLTQVGRLRLSRSHGQLLEAPAATTLLLLPYFPRSCYLPTIFLSPLFCATHAPRTPCPSSCLSRTSR